MTPLKSRPWGVTTPSPRLIVRLFLAPFPLLSALATWSPSALSLNLKAPQSESVMTDGADDDEDDEGETGSTWFSFFLRLLDG